ncbi:MAG: hypothetical protein ABSA78_14425 [Candidatus Sulfotelmatobacter sp.]|jgi:hypothetical protein
MSATVPEFRKPVMTWVEASWDDSSGKLQIVPARMEDKSSGGACIRLKTRIGVGSKLRIKWRFEQFSGITKYCRSEGAEYVVGIQRDAVQSPVPDPPSPSQVPPQEPLRSTHPKISNVKAPAATSTPASEDTRGTDESDRILRSRLEEFDALRRTQLRTKRPQKEEHKEIKRMEHKWLELVPWHNKHDHVSGSGNGNGEASADGNGHNQSKKENFMAHAPVFQKNTAADPDGEAFASVEVELLPMDDIYRLAGIMEPRKGYSIKKVVEMLHNKHIRGLSKEMKRAALLMALDAAGISLAQVEHDAKARQDALDAHEAEQRKQIESEWARKTEEISQIQNEMERAKTHFMARISRNLDGVAREKATFNGWLTVKQQEAESMAEALELCLKAQIPEAAAPSKQLGSATDRSGESASDMADVPATDLRLAKAASAKTM